MKKTTESGEQLERMQQLTTSLGGAAGVMIIVYAGAYLLGHRYLSNYFSDIGAPWALTLFGPIDIIQTPSSFGTLVVTFALIFWANPAIVKDATSKFSVINAVIAVTCAAVHFAVFKLMPGYDSYWDLAGWLFGFIAAGSYVAYLLKITTSIGGLAGARTFAVIMFIVVFFAIPAVSDLFARGKIKAIRAGAAPIHFDAGKGGNWQLVRAMPNSQILVAKAEPGKKIVFRLIPATDATEIQSTK